MSGRPVTGKVYESSTSPSDELRLQYSTSDIQSSYVGCQVGALVPTGNHNTAGCFKATGTVSNVPGVTTDLDYTYEPEQDNLNGRTIKGFSTAVRPRMLECPKCPYPDAKFFVDYYGDSDYADKWITASFTGGRTNFGSGRGNADFGSYGFTGRGECAKKGTVFMAIFMYVIREFEDALDDCQNNCIACNDDPVHAWDEGVAFYSGSLEGKDGSAPGVLLHELADKRCANFNTCIDENNSKSAINDQLTDLFVVGQAQLLSGRCEEARVTKSKIVDLMYIPMIQGTLRYAYRLDLQAGGEKEEAEGAVFAAAVLPRIHAADPSAAELIYNNMRVGRSSTDFKAVKTAFESVYSKMNIKCSDVGGLLSPEGGYFPGAGPCGDSSSAKKGGLIAGAVVGSIGGAAALIAIGYIFYMRGREKRGNPVFKPSTRETAVSEIY
mmetsp:Transcript_3680/g.6993  ORF Transcript_3680/g.6993 Transcript_3680/m.6993 type:complete len:438 (+) Transcript_3680:3298-4611(+)